MAGWMINCKEYVELTSQSMDRKLSFWDRVSMKIHQMLCPPCKHIRQQFDAIRSACRFSSVDDTCNDTPECISGQACERIKAAIEKAAQDKDG